ncbi:electron transfer flavoprotein subunit alpha/FixB family protein [Fusibacter sp. 3D3]|uniref:electron transfer flavoprotein subunit alpha/FixB family protein n=1 Tax=Fusibacter sp. 3D3 TaxID=1048380 RepID=UPI000852B803|nr:electron transfer flavoprotein subunit alpha/FixB family protein [Fusibacter sp. 3D3]GAU76428.1 alpha subunit electron transfer flavoprotein [Fusibacter sp. 3D3]
MAKILIHDEYVKSPDKLIKLCPFNAIEYMDSKLSINSGCKMCKLCVKQAPEIFEFVEAQIRGIHKEEWKGVAVYMDHVEGNIHPVSFELIGKARALAEKINHPVHAVLMGSHMEHAAEQILKYGVDEVFLYDDVALENFRIEPYAACFEDYILAHKPSIVLVGGTTIGRSLAPRLAARFRTGLTADCTFLDVQENTDLDQIRPAFGGNIMAHIHTPNHRPQFATVRYKIFDAPEMIKTPFGKITKCTLDQSLLKSQIDVLEVHAKEKSESIEDAEVIVVVGSAFKKKEDLNMAFKLADLLDARVASTRPLIEKGWMDAKLQIGLSGRTVRPKLIITCGVSGSVQFVAGMKGADQIMAINIDKEASIFNTAHYAIVGDIYEVLPKLIERIENERA